MEIESATTAPGLRLVEVPMKLLFVAMLFLAFVGVARGELGQTPSREDKPLAHKKTTSPQRGHRAPYPSRALGHRDETTRDDTDYVDERPSGGQGHGQGHGGGRGGGRGGDSRDADDDE
jgi:hypothetical protein